MKGLAMMTPADASPGFRLAGVVQHICTPETAAAALREVMGDPGIGFIGLDERLLAKLGNDGLADLEKNWPGIVVLLPPPEKAMAGVEDYAMQLIRRAIGYHVRIF